MFGGHVFNDGLHHQVRVLSCINSVFNVLDTRQCRGHELFTTLSGGRREEGREGEWEEREGGRKEEERKRSGGRKMGRKEVKCSREKEHQERTKLGLGFYSFTPKTDIHTFGSSANFFLATRCRLVLILSSALERMSLLRSTTYTVWPV